MESDIRCLENYQLASNISECLCKLINQRKYNELPADTLQSLSSSVRQLEVASKALNGEESSTMISVADLFERLSAPTKDEEEFTEACLLLLENIVDHLVLLELSRVNGLTESINLAMKILNLSVQSQTFHDVLSTMKSFLTEWSHLMTTLDPFVSSLVDVGQQKTIRCILHCMYKVSKYVIENAAETGVYPLSKHTKFSRSFLIQGLHELSRYSIRAIGGAADCPPDACESIIVDSGLPNFVAHLDKLLDCLGKTVERKDLVEIEERIGEVVGHAENVAAATGEDGRKVIMNFIDRVIAEFKGLQLVLAENESATTESAMTCDYVADFLELLEQQVNAALLSLILESFGRIHEPIETAIRQPGSPDIGTFIERLMKVTELTAAATPSEQAVLEIRAASWLLRSSAEQITHVLASENRDEKLVSLLRIWKKEVKILKVEVEGLVDPCAFSQVVEKKVRKLGEKLKQSVGQGRSKGVWESAQEITGSAEYLVEFLTNPGVLDTEGLSELPIKETKSALREIKAAAKVVSSDATDQKLNSLLKRVEVLVTTLEKIGDVLVKFYEDGDDSETKSEPSSATESRTLESGRRKSLRSRSHHAISIARSLQKFPEDVRLLPIDINTPAPKRPLRIGGGSLPTTPRISSTRALKTSFTVADLTKFASASVAQCNGTFTVEKVDSIQFNFTEILENITKLQADFSGNTVMEQ